MWLRFALSLAVCFFIAVPASGAAQGVDAGAATRELPPKFKFEINSFYKNRFKGPKSVFVDRKHGEVYVVDPSRGEVLIFDTLGTPVFSFGGRPGEFAPLDIAVRNERIYLTYENKPYIEVLSLKGEPVKTLTPSEGKFVAGRMDMDEEGNIYVVNKATDRCLVLDKNDDFTGSIGEGVAPPPGGAAGGGRGFFLKPVFQGNLFLFYTVK